MSIVAIVLLVFLAIICIWFLFSSIVNVGGEEVALLERKYFGAQLSSGRIFALPGQVGMQARYLNPGKIYFLIPFIFSTTKVGFTVIEKNQVGIVESLDGDPVTPGHIFGQVVDCNFFQDAEAFLKNGGQKGPQVQILPPGVYKINTQLFKVVVEDAVAIPESVIGVVIAQDGLPIPTGRLLASHVEGHNNFQDGQAFIKANGQKGPQLDILLPGVYYINKRLFNIKTAKATVIASGQVGMIDALDGEPLPNNEYVAKSVPNHRDYQDGAAFLSNGGQRGPQLDVLRPGTYYINPFMFGVIPANATEIQRGQVAVVVSNIGPEPSDEIKAKMVEQSGASNDSSKSTYVVPKGYRGIQEKAIGPGRYYLNTKAFIPYIIDTTNQTIDWDTEESVDFDPLSIVSKDGFVITVSVKVIVRVRPDQAPFMVAKVGSIESLKQNVIHPMIDSSFRNQASTTEAMNFMQNRKEEQQKAEDHVRDELEKYHVECVSVLICQINLPQNLMDTQTSKVIAQQQVLQYVEQQKSEEGRIAVEKTRSMATGQPAIANAEIQVKVAEQKKLETVTLAEANSQATRLRGEGEAAQIAAIGNANAEAYQKQQQAVGQTNLTILKVVEQLKDSKLKFVPDILTVGAGAEGGLSGVLTKLLAAGQVGKV